MSEDYLAIYLEQHPYAAALLSMWEAQSPMKVDGWRQGGELLKRLRAMMEESAEVMGELVSSGQMNVDQAREYVMRETWPLPNPENPEA